MTPYVAIAEADALQPNYYETEQKLKWLTRLDQQIKREILDTHERNAEDPLNFFTEGVGYESYAQEDWSAIPLLVPPPYDEIYIHWLCMQIDLYNQEMEKYNNAGALFSAAYDAFAKAWHRSHRPKSVKRRFF